MTRVRNVKSIKGKEHDSRGHLWRALTSTIGRDAMVLHTTIGREGGGLVEATYQCQYQRTYRMTLLVSGQLPF